MAALRNSVMFVLLASLALYGAQPVQGQFNPALTLSCPPGYLAQGARNVPATFCTTDPCYVSPCGPGNTCTIFDNVFGAIANCSVCNPPYTRANVPIGFPFIFGQDVCYIPGQDACNPNPCNGGSCSYRLDQNTGQPLTDAQGTRYAFQCNCTSTGRAGVVCDQPIQPTPSVTATLNGVTGPLASVLLVPGICGSTPNTVACLYADGKHFTCCNGYQQGCGPVGPDGVPLCPNGGFTPTPNDYPVQSTPAPQSAPPSGDQGVCGSGDATLFPTRCYFNSDPQGRYVCCDNQGCNGFNADNLTPHCANYGFVPPNYGLSGPTPPSTPPSSPPSAPPSGDQGVCGSGAASDFPTRCYFNSDPQGRYVCCDGQGCNGFNSDNLTPHCQNFGYVPPNFGLAGPTTPSTPPSGPPSSPPSGNQGVCGTGDAQYFPVRCYFNSDPQGRYVCCDNNGCNGFNPPDNLFPRCQVNGYVPPGFGI